ncbi:MAG: histone deacetylase [Candidatus Hydrothermarchaeales archaeon]
MIIYSERYLEHNMEYHPENNNRLRRTMSLLTKKNVFDSVALIEPEPANKEDILRVHTDQHMKLISEMSHKGGGMIGPDTYITEKSFDTAMLSAGGMITALEQDDYKYAFTLIRPPGHHATPNDAMGFCIFNNIAVAAKYAMEKLDKKRVFILDFDVHHGNGTQDIFYKDPRVLFASLHQHPLYPGTGRMDEIGSGEGEGYTLNIPLPPKITNNYYLRALDEIILPVLKEFDPELILVSSGYDGHYDDPLGDMCLSSHVYYNISKRLKRLDIKTIFTLEGGYNLDVLSNSIYATMAPIFDLEEDFFDTPLEENKKIAEYVTNRIDTVKKIHKNYWSFS